MTTEFGDLYDLCYPRPRFRFLPPGHRIAVLSPHPDDEVIGCGGSIARLLESGAEVTVIYMTSGTSLGHDRGGPCDSERYKEAKLALDRLGQCSARFLGSPSDGVLNPLDLAPKLAWELSDLKADAIYVPHVADRHVDHFLTNASLACCIGSIEALVTHIVQFEIWSPLIPTLLINITDYMTVKTAAIQCHSSQLNRYDYVTLAERNGRYRATMHHPDESSRLVSVHERRWAQSRGRTPLVPWTHLEAFRVTSTRRFLGEFNRFCECLFSGGYSLEHLGDS